MYLKLKEEAFHTPVNTIKEFRSITNCSLKEAKKVFDYIRDHGYISFKQIQNEISYSITPELFNCSPSIFVIVKNIEGNSCESDLRELVMKAVDVGDSVLAEELLNVYNRLYL